MIIGALDYGFQRFEWERDLRMSRDEIKEESRAAEGDPSPQGQDSQYAERYGS
jgi:flagellar biosynthetic protein FlhB